MIFLTSSKNRVLNFSLKNIFKKMNKIVLTTTYEYFCIKIETALSLCVTRRGKKHIVEQTFLRVLIYEWCK